MSDTTFTALTQASGIDAATDWLGIDRTSLNTTQKINRNTLLGISGSPVGTSDSQTLTNKIITSPTLTVLDNALTIQDNLDATKQLQFQLSGITTATTRTLTIPNASTTIVGTDATQTLTNKTLTSPVISGGSIDNTTITVDSVVGHTSATSGTIYGLSISSSKVGTNGVITGSITNSAVDYTKVATGFCVQEVSALFTAVATGTTLLPYDNTIPQNTEGDQYMTLAITPKATTNILEITVSAWLSNSAINNMGVALFQDSTANALAASSATIPSASYVITLPLTHTMAAGTTSATTFKVRIGGNIAGTTTFNGQTGGSIYGAITKSSIIIREYKA